ncbi:putative ammonium transporter 1 isoform X4 [Cryptotermes secundus]|uniref:putative ammonium transporter 1 isoform X4 n=1 Tax=Cryptotermes secundus TaxID=105785 RepID=UPI000CD7B8B9|nr:putative ammonium transporter 1 isoform X4 [Cryptotermes secundus]
MASNVTDMEALNNDINDLFQLTNGIILILMQIGFACLEAGAVRSKNTTNIMMKNLMDICFSCVSYWLVGYALAYGRGDTLLGYTYFAGRELPSEKLAHWFFQFGFAATAATIVSGAVAERCNYIAYIVYSIGISGFIYPPVTHWAWTDEGWLNKLGYVDFAGSGPIHLLGGVCSFCAALFLGPRLGRFGAGKEQIVGHSVPVSVCASVNKMEFWASFLTGVIAGVVFINIHYFMLWCKVDDPLDAVAVHFGGGFWGVISASLFSHGGIAYGANKQAAMFLAYEMVGACAIISWGWAASCVMFGTLKLLGKLRVSEEDEQKGLDIAMHNEPGYHPMGWKTFPPVSETSSALVSHNDGHNKKNNAYRLRQPDFINPGFSDTENGIHPLEVSVRM